MFPRNNNNMNKRNSFEAKINKIMRKALKEGFFDKEYASKEVKRREMRKIISNELNINAEFIEVKEAKSNDSSIYAIRVEAPIFLK